MEGTDAREAVEPAPGGLPDLSLLKVMDLGRVVERLLEVALASREASLLELRVLSVCAARPGITAVEVSRVILVDPPAVSRLVQPLAQRGLLSRRRSRTDRREVRLRVTADGLALLRECQPLLEQASTRFLQPLGAAQERSFRRAIETLLDSPVSPSDGSAS